MKIGIIIPTNVNRLLSCTVFFRPILFIKRAVGTERSRNHRNTMEGMKPDTVSLRPKSVFT